jgi:hypothetical protein
MFLSSPLPPNENNYIMCICMLRRRRRHRRRLQQTNDSLPTTLDAGVTSISQSGSHTITVEIQLVLEDDTTSSSTSSAIDSTSTSSREYQSFAPGASFAPLALVVGLAATTNMVSDENKCGITMLDFACTVTRFVHVNSIHSSLHHVIMQVELSLAMGIFTGSCSECSFYLRPKQEAAVFTFHSLIISRHLSPHKHTLTESGGGELHGRFP